MNIRILQKDKIAWLTAAPLWDRSIEISNAPSDRFRAPMLLRFRGDDFMDQLATTLATDPTALSGYAAQAESWRKERVGWRSTAASTPLRLYQPVHNRYYLAAASLVCQRAGLPDRKLDKALGDRATLVLRRLVERPGLIFDPTDPARRSEQAWIGDAQSGRWVALDDPALPDAAEERLPMFPLLFEEAGRPRRLQAGLIPVARANVYTTAAEGSPANAAEAVSDPLGDPRIAALVDGALGGLELLADLATAPAPPSSVAADQRLRARSSLVFALLDLGEHLELENPTLVSGLRNGSISALAPEEKALHTRLVGVSVPSGLTVGQAIIRALDRRDRLVENDINDALLLTVLGDLPSLMEIGTLAGQLLGGLPALKSLIEAALSDQRAAALRDLAQSAIDRIEAAGSSGASDDVIVTLLQELLAIDDFLKRELPEIAAAMPDGSTPFAADAVLLARFASTLVPLP